MENNTTEKDSIKELYRRIVENDLLRALKTWQITHHIIDEMLIET